MQKKISKQKVKSHYSKLKMNKLYYAILSDNVLVAYAAKGNADGEPGYLKPVLQALNHDMNANEGEGDGFAELV